MKILALIGTPRKRSNTDLLVDQILEGSRVKSPSAIVSTYLFTFLTMLMPESSEGYSHILWLMFLDRLFRFLYIQPIPQHVLII